MAKVSFTAPRLAAFQCGDKPQSFLWDASTPGLALRVTKGGGRAYVFQSRFGPDVVRVTIGGLDSWAIKAAQKRARELQTMIDEGRDPRVVKAERVAADVAVRDAKRRRAVQVSDAWSAYLADRAPHWGERHARDHERLARAGGEVPKSGIKNAKAEGKLTTAGPLHGFLSMPLASLDAGAIETWAKRESISRPTQARLALRLLRAFVAWCGTHAEYGPAVAGTNPAKSKKARESLGRPNAKKDVLLREQLPAWFQAARALNNPMHAAFLQALLLCGCRPGELLGLQWADIDFTWKSLTIRDKTEGRRVIPLVAYVAHLLVRLPRRNGNPWVFSSGSSESGCMSNPADAFERVNSAAGTAVTAHGLRRSFKSLSEWKGEAESFELPSGIVGQIQGHRASGIAERHYTVRPLDLLRRHHEQFAGWILRQGAVEFDAAEPKSLRIVA
jgi:integrase